MTISNRQFALLNAMNIPLWACKANKNKQTEKKSLSKAIVPNLAELKQNKLFLDILLSMKLAISDVSVEASHLNLGDFTWSLTEQDSISFEQNSLCTPMLATLAQSLPLKKQLWQIIKDNIIVSDPAPSENQS